ncbi:MAG: hypothetical protein H6672_21605 [Anaerolineaceae bacterium]|nr:hypothetical protein [Anaerolineaceae bacterium]
MFPLFTTPPSGEESGRRTDILAALTIGLAISMGMAVLFLGDQGNGIEQYVPFFFIFIMPGILAAKRRRQSQAQSMAEMGKAKRGLDGLDMYALIDRMVDEIDDDEAVYLRRRLEAHQRRLEREATKESLVELLDERDAERYTDNGIRSLF